MAMSSAPRARNSPSRIHLRTFTAMNYELMEMIMDDLWNMVSS
jgi:hypothetical protein